MGLSKCGWKILHDLVDQQFGTDTYAVNATAAGVSGAGGSMDALFSAGRAAIAGLSDIYNDASLPHAASDSVSLSNAKLTAAMNRMVSQYPGRGDMAGLLYVRRAPDAKAKDSGQYGLNLSGYLDNVGEGVEWVFTTITHTVTLQE